MQWVEPPSIPWQDVAIDVLGPLPSGENLLVVVDYGSRFFEVLIIRSTTSQKMMEALTPIFTRMNTHSALSLTTPLSLCQRNLKTS